MISARLGAEARLPLLDPNSIDFSNSILVVNRTPRFIVPVPPLEGGGELLVYPAESPKAGAAIKETPDGSADRGIVFFNPTDSAWQAARGNGLEAIVINSVDPQTARALHARIQSTSLQTLEQIKDLLRYAHDELGLKDFYHKKLAAIEQETAIIDPANPAYREVTKTTLHRAVYIARGFMFEGPVTQIYRNGGILLNDGKKTWGIETETFLKNFRAVSNGAERRLRTLAEEFFC